MALIDFVHKPLFLIRMFIIILIFLVKWLPELALSPLTFLQSQFQMPPTDVKKKSHLALLLHNTTFNQMGMHSYTMGKYIKAKTPIFTIKGDKNK